MSSPHSPSVVKARRTARPCHKSITATPSGETRGRASRPQGLARPIGRGADAPRYRLWLPDGPEIVGTELGWRRPPPWDMMCDGFPCPICPLDDTTPCLGRLRCLPLEV